MKIVYLHQYFATPTMSGGTRSYEMARRLVRLGHEVHLITSSRETSGGPTGWHVTDEQGIQVHWYPVAYSHQMGFAARVRAFLSFAAVAGTRAAATGADLVFASSTPLTIALPAIYAARRLRAPMVFEVRDLWPELPIAVGMLRNPILIRAARWLERFAYRNSAQIVALAPRMAEEIARAGYPSERITMIPNGCDRELFGGGDAATLTQAGREFRLKHPWLGDRPLVIYTGTIGQVNDVEYLAHLAAQVSARDPEIRFLLLGHGRHEEKVRQIVREAGILDRSFFMLPPVAKVELPAILATSDLAMSTCADIEVQWQGASQNKFFDALAAGVPVGLNYRGWLGDLITERGAGLVLDRHDLAGAAELLVRSLRDPAWARRAREAARNLSTERFDRDRLATDLDRVLRRAHAAHVAPGAPASRSG